MVSPTLPLPIAPTDVMLVGGSASAGGDVPADRVYAPNALRIAGWPASRLANMAQGGARTMYSTLLLESFAAPLPRGVWIWEHAMNDVYKCTSPAALACVLEAFLVRIAALKPALVVLLFLWPCSSPLHRARVDDRGFAACRSVIESYALKMPLVAINVPAWLRASPPAIESEFTVGGRLSICHPSPHAHDMFAAIIAELLGNQSQPASASSPADLSASPGTSPASAPLAACANPSIAAREGELALRVASARAIFSFNAWRPSLASKMSAGNRTAATWLAARVTDAASGSAPRDLPPIGECEVRGRHDCKRSVELPQCVSGRTLYFALPSHTHISAVHYKSSVAANITWTASGVEELSPTAAELHEVTDPCFATVDWARRQYRDGVTRERWWLPDAPVPARGLRLCAQTPGAALHWLAVADVAHSKN